MNLLQMSEHQCRIANFMLKAGQSLPPCPVVPSESIRVLRARLILEECLETIEALGIQAFSNVGGFQIHNDEIDFFTVGEPDLVEIADGCADISVVTYGTLLACGIADEPIIKAVDESNLAKFSEGGYRREDGKWMKPPGWQKPDLLKLLKDQGLVLQENGLLQGDCETPADMDDDDLCDDPTDVWEAV